MEKKVKVTAVGTYNGHSVRANGIVSFNVSFNYSELVNTIQMTQMLNNDIKLLARYGNAKAIELGMFTIDNIHIGSDGTSKVRFKGIVDYVETDNLNSMALNGREDLFNIRLISNIEVNDEINEDDITF